MFDPRKPVGLSSVIDMYFDIDIQFGLFRVWLLTVPRHEAQALWSAL